MVRKRGFKPAFFGPPDPPMHEGRLSDSLLPRPALADPLPLPGFQGPAETPITSRRLVCQTK